MLTAWRGPDKVKDIVEKNYAKIQRYCAAHLFYDDDAACSCTHEVMVAYMEKYETIGPERLPGWLYRAADIVIARYKTTIAKANERELHYEQMPDGEQLLGQSYLPEEPTISDQQVSRMKDQVLDQLDDEEKRLLVLIYSQKMRKDKAAELLGIKPSALSMRLHRLQIKVADLSKEAAENCANGQI